MGQHRSQTGGRRRLTPGPAALVPALALMLAVLGVPAVPVQAATFWGLGSPPGHGPSTFSAVSCPTPSFCVAVGWQGVPQRALIELFKAGRWSMVQSPGVGEVDHLDGVSCTSATACVAVGSYSFSSSNQALSENLVEYYDGRRWSFVNAPNLRQGIGDGLGSVSCAASTFCAAIETNGGSLIKPAHDGHWFPVPTARRGSGASVLTSVYCTSSRWCVAVGGYQATGYQPFVQTYQGKGWSVVPDANPTGGELNSVTCVTDRSCTAVGGNGQQPLIESFNGTAWSLVAAPDPGSVYNDLNGIACTSVLSCVAVGQYSDGGTSWGTLVVSLLHGAWVDVPSPDQGYSPDLDSVSCGTTASCMAVGYDLAHPGTGPYQSLVEMGPA